MRGLVVAIALSLLTACSPPDFKGEADRSLAARATAQRKAAEAQLSNAASVVIVSKDYVPKDVQAERFDDEVNFVIAVQNKTPKDIAGIKGSFEFDDMFGTKIKEMLLSMDDGVKAGQTFTTSSYSMNVNQFEDSDTKLAMTDLSKLKVVFHPQIIVFGDGTKLTASPETSGP